jgi:L-iditol 2-dehydrogenase
MKALVLEDYMNLVYKDVPEPEIEPDEVLVQVKACGICGSDAHGMDGSSGRRIPPIIMGHEASGVITQIGNNVNGWKIGDRVTFDSTIYKLDDWYTRKGMYNLSDGRMVLGVSPGEYRRHGAFAEYVAVPQHILYKLPEQVTFNQAAMVEPVAVAFHAVELTPIDLDDTAVVIGAGMIGLFIIQALKLKGCGKIIAVDMEQDRLDLAQELGADVVFKADQFDVPAEVKKLSSGRGADIAFEAVGIEQTIHTAIHSVRRGATVTLVGNLSPVVQIPLQAVVTQQIRLQGSCAIAGEYPAVLNMIARGRINVDAILTNTAPLSDGAIWFKRVYEKEPGVMKVVLNPGD